jgi:hypothetical protein
MQDDLNFKINLNENDANAYGSQKSTDVKVTIHSYFITFPQL